jgi:hypothetical protein
MLIKDSYKDTFSAYIIYSSASERHVVLTIDFEVLDNPLILNKHVQVLDKWLHVW